MGFLGASLSFLTRFFCLVAGSSGAFSTGFTADNKIRVRLSGWIRRTGCEVHVQDVR